MNAKKNTNMELSENTNGTENKSDLKQLLCNRCGIEMKDGKAIQNQLSTGVSDFPGMDINSSGQTLSYSGPPKLVKVKKCPKCGKSIKVA